MKLKLAILTVAATAVLLSSSKGAAREKQTDWVKLFDGKTLNGWKASDPQHNSWKVEDGAIVANGEPSHLFYVGDPEPFVNFELKVDVMTRPGSNGGIYFHSRYQETGWPKYGFEVQVNQTQQDWRKTGSLYAVEDVKEQLVKDNEWYTYDIIVRGKKIVIKVNDRVAVDWTQEPDRQPGKDATRVLDKGTFALQAHDPKSTVYYRNIMVRRIE
jgi:hypothetical protein